MTSAHDHSASTRLPSSAGSLSKLVDGDEVDLPVEILAFAKKYTKREEMPYLKLLLGDASRIHSGTAWSDSLDSVLPAISVGAVIRAEGCFTDNGYGADVVIHKATLLGPGEYDPRAIFVFSPIPYEQLTAELDALIDMVGRPCLKDLLVRLLVKGDAADRWRVAPASLFSHQAYRHGLLEHSVLMARCASQLAGVFAGIDRDLAITGALLHDIGKVDAYASLGSTTDYSDSGWLKGEIPLGFLRIHEEMAKIDEFPTELADQLEHIVLSHHGRLEHGSPVQPCSRVAAMVYVVDDLASKTGAFDRHQAKLRDGETWGQWDRLLDRRLYFPAGWPVAMEIPELQSTEEGASPAEGDAPAENEVESIPEEPKSTESVPDAKAEAEPASEAEGEPEAKEETEPTSEPEAESEAEPASEPDAESEPEHPCPARRDDRRKRVRPKTSGLVKTRADLSDYLLKMAEDYASEYPRLLEGLQSRRVFGMVGSVSKAGKNVSFDLKQGRRRLHCQIERATYDRIGIELKNRASVLVTVKPTTSDRTKLLMNVSDIDMWVGEAPESTGELQPRSVDEYVLRLTYNLAGRLGPELVATRPLRQIRGVVGKFDLASDPARFYLLDASQHGVRCEVRHEVLAASELQLKSGVEAVITATPTTTPEAQLLFEVQDLVLEEGVGSRGRPPGTDAQTQRCLEVIINHEDRGISTKGIAEVFLEQDLPAEEWAELNREGKEKELERAILRRRTNVYGYIRRLKADDKIDEGRRGRSKLWFPVSPVTDEEQ